MYKLLIILSICILAKSDQTKNLCSNIKSENLCICQRVTDPDSRLPVTSVDCADVSLKNIPNEKQLRRDIHHLDLSLNDITELDQQNYEFASETLTRLTISHNNIDYISDEFFSVLPNLRYLDLSHNNITSVEDDVFIYTKDLVRLDLSFNSLSGLSRGLLTKLHKIEYLDLSYNPLGDFLTRSINILNSDVGLRHNITYLGLNRVGLKHLDNKFFDSFQNLRHLSLADNDFEVIPEVSYSIEYLDLSGNKIKDISPAYLYYHSLKVLKLNRMSSLTSIQQFAFYNMALEKLYITDCYNLEEFNEKVFGILSKTTEVRLKHLVLARNGLKNLNNNYQFLFEKMEYVDLSENQWDCDCDLLWLNKYDSILRNTDNLRCATPDRIYNVKITDLQKSDQPQCFPQNRSSRKILMSSLIVCVILLCICIIFLIRNAPYVYGSKKREINIESPYNGELSGNSI